MSDRLRHSELGMEKFCIRCNEWWPADKEFFWETKGKLFYCCKACYHAMDKRKGRRGLVVDEEPLVPENLQMIPFQPTIAPAEH